MTEQRPPLLGLWDLTMAPAKLGSLLIFLEELLLVRRQNHLSAIDVAFIQDPEKEAINQPYLASVLAFLPGHNQRFFFTDHGEWAAFLARYPAPCTLWPGDHPLASTSYPGSTLAVQEMVESTGELVPLRGSQQTRKAATDWLAAHLDLSTTLPVVLHLKNQPHDPESNADPESWGALFEHSARARQPVHFVLIGNDAIDDSLRAMANVTCVQPHPSGLLLDLALIETAFFFMGMASGPCNMALFGTTPYLIWKHPDHHAAEMEREFRGHRQFSFAGRNQHFCRQYDRPDVLIAAFTQLLERLDGNRWRQQLRKGADHARP